MKSHVIGVVGPCGSGKSELVKGLRALGFSVRHIAQEHSYVQDMWKRITNPDILVYLDAGYEETVLRAKLNWTEQEYNEQILRLKHAKESSDIFVQTDNQSIEQVLNTVVNVLIRTSDDGK